MRKHLSRGGAEVSMAGRMFRARDFFSINALACLLLAPVGPASALDAKDMGGLKQISFLVGTSAGAGFDLYARTLAEYLPRHLPGTPHIVVQNNPGAAGLAVASNVYNLAPTDGSVIAMCPPGIALSEVVDPDAYHFKMRELSWIGTITTMTDVLAVMKSSGIRSLEDAKNREVVVGATGKLGALNLYPSLANAVIGTKFKPVLGYAGGNEVNLAMERGEVQGRTNQWDSWVAQRPDWIRDGKLTYLLQFGPPLPELKGTPRLLDLVRDPSDRDMVNLAEILELVGRSIFTSPRVSNARLETLRQGFEETMRDQGFLARMKELELDTSWRTGLELQADLDRAMSDARETAARLVKQANLK